MKPALGLIASLLMSLLSCGAAQEITFKRAQQPGQKSSCAMKNSVKTRPSPESPAMDLTMDATIETEVTSVQPNRNWTLTTKSSINTAVQIGLIDKQAPAGLRGPRQSGFGNVSSIPRMP